ncbi:MAG: hypothetical protein AAGL11_06230 [Pseudomonadota bacterium]
MTSCLDEKLKTPSVSEWLAETKPKAEGRWELVLTVELDDGVVLAKMVLKALAPTGLFSEESRIVFVQDGETSSDLHADVEGELFPDQAAFSVHIQDPETPLTPFVCSGTATQPEKAYAGDWRAACGDPEGCGCEGMSGPFTLTAL